MLLLALSMAAPTFAQGGGASSTGTIQGRVTDSQGAVLPGVNTTGQSLWSLQANATTNFTYILAMNLVLWSSWALFAPIPLVLGRKYRFDRQGWRRALLVHVPAALATTSAHLDLVGSGMRRTTIDKVECARFALRALKPG